MVPQVNENFQLEAVRLLAAECPVPGRGFGVGLGAWEGASRGRVSVMLSRKKSQQGSERRLVTWGSESQGTCVGLEKVVGDTCAKPCRHIKDVRIIPKRNEKALEGFKQGVHKIIFVF